MDKLTKEQQAMLARLLAVLPPIVHVDEHAVPVAVPNPGRNAPEEDEDNDWRYDRDAWGW